MSRGQRRHITREVAERFAAALASDVNHSIESAAYSIKANPATIRSCLSRFERNQCETEEDDAIGYVLAAARALHVLELRRLGDTAGREKNAAGVAWYRWRLETQAPKEHPRKEHVEVTGSNGGPVTLAPIPYAEALEELRKLRREDPAIAAALLPEDDPP